jgi:(2Fe-2S) ferredoxin
VLERWEEHGALWRVVHLSDARAIVDLCTCHGEPVEQLESDDAALIAWLRARAES